MEYRVRLWGYVAGPDGKRVDDIIAFWTGLFPCNWGTPKLSHVELEFVEHGKCFSSATRGDFTGVRFEDTGIVLRHFERWIKLEFTVDGETYYRMYHRARGLVGRKYDWWAVFLGWLIPWRIEDKKKWYCSEVVAEILRVGRLIKCSKRISPRWLWKVVRRVLNRVGRP